MKKLLAISIILVMFSGIAFAQNSIGVNPDGVRLGFMGMAAVVPLEAKFIHNQGDYLDANGNKNVDALMSTQFGWGAGAETPRARLQFGFTSEKIGFVFQFQTDGGNPYQGGFVSVGDMAEIWAKPFDWLRIDMGNFEIVNLKGKVAATSMNAFVLNSADANHIFQSFQTAAGDSRQNQQFGGAMLTLTPIDNLFVGALIGRRDWFLGALGNGIRVGPTHSDNIANSPGNAWNWAGDNYGPPFAPAPPTGAVPSNLAAPIYERVQIGAGYTIPDIGQIRLQYLGWGQFTGTLDAGALGRVTSTHFNNYDKRVEAAFALTAVKGWSVDLGLKWWFPELVHMNSGAPSTDDEVWLWFQRPTSIALGVNGAIQDIGINVMFWSAFGNAWWDKDTPSTNQSHRIDTNVHITPSYKIADNLTVGLNFGIRFWNVYFAYDEGTKLDVKDDLGLNEKDADMRVDFGVGIWIQQQLGIGLIQAGVTFTVPALQNSAQYDPILSDEGVIGDTAAIFRFPIRLQLMF